MTVATDLSTTTGTWVIDPAHTRLGFAAKHAMVTTVRGSFGTFDGKLVLDGENPADSRAEVTIDAASINTGQEQRDGHLKSADFLDVDNFPTLTFASTEVRQDGDEFLLVEKERFLQKLCSLFVCAAASANESESRKKTH